MIRSLAASLLAGALVAAGLAPTPAAAHHPVEEFDDIAAPFACGTEWSGGTRSGHGENNWNLDFNRTSLVWPDRQHDLGQPLFAQGDGTVTYIGWQTNAGTYLDIDYGDYAARYIHLVDDSVVHEVGDVVAAGDTIALLGDTGNTPGFAHLHLEYWDSRDLDDYRIWELKQEGRGQTEITFDGDIIEPDEVIVSTNCAGDALLAGVADGMPMVDDPLRAEAAALLAAEDPVPHLADRLIDLGAVSPTATTEAADLVFDDDVAAIVPGTADGDEVVLVVAHHRRSSACPPGIDPPCAMPFTNGVPTAIALALVERLVETPTDRTVLVLFVGDDDAAGTALTHLVTPPEPNPDLDPLIEATVGAVHLGALGETATLRYRNDSLLTGTATLADPSALPALGATAGLTWHHLNEPPWPGNISALDDLGVPTIGLRDTPGPCRGALARITDADPAKVARQLDDADTLLRWFADGATELVGATPVRTDTLLDDLAVIAELLRHAEPIEESTVESLTAWLEDIDAFLLDPPTEWTDDDVARATTLLGIANGAFNDEPCDSHGVPGPFTDVADTSYALADVALLFDLAITTGTSPTTYSPGNDVTREQMAAFLGRIWRLLDPEAAATDPAPFVDVDPDSFAVDDIALLWELEITTGTSPTTYSPADVVTREQMAAFLARIARLLDPAIAELEPDPHPFTDVDEGSFAVDDISLIFALGITTGTSPTTYSPDDVVTREQMAAFLARLLRRVTDPPLPEHTEDMEETGTGSDGMDGETDDPEAAEG